MGALSFWLEQKAIDENGHIEGLAAGYGNEDFGGDVIVPGAIKSIEQRSSLPMLLFHDHKKPVGVWQKFEETSDGLRVKGRFSMNSEAGRDAYGMAKDGALPGLSIGYQTLKHKLVGKARHLQEIILHEISLVTVPMNERTLVSGVKELEDLRAKLAAGDRLELREMERLLRKGLNLSNAEAERAVRLHFKGPGEPAGTNGAEAFYKALLA